MSYLNLSSPHSALSLSDVEERCKQAAALKLPLSSLELNREEVQELFQVSDTNVSVKITPDLSEQDQHRCNQV